MDHVLSKFSMAFLPTQKEMSFFITQLMTILVLAAWGRGGRGGLYDHLRDKIFHGRISLSSVFQQLLMIFLIGSRLELMYIRSSLIYLSGFQLLVLLV